MISSLFRSLESAIHERLAMIEEVIANRGGSTNSTAYDSMAAQMRTLEERIRKLEGGCVQPLAPAPPVSDGCGKWFDALRDLQIDLPEKVPKVPVVLTESVAITSIAETPVKKEPVVQEVPVKKVALLVEEEDVVLVEETEEEVEEAEEAEEAEEEEEEAEEEEGVELEEIIFKGKTYYKDPENNVYMPTDDGGCSDDPIGTWDVARSRVLFKRVAPTA